MHSLLPKLGKPNFHHKAYFFTSETWPMNKLAEIKNLGRKPEALSFLTSKSARVEPRNIRLKEYL